MFILTEPTTEANGDPGLLERGFKELSDLGFILRYHLGRRGDRDIPVAGRGQPQPRRDAGQVTDHLSGLLHSRLARATGDWKVAQIRLPFRVRVPERDRANLALIRQNPVPLPEHEEPRTVGRRAFFHDARNPREVIGKERKAFVAMS